MAKTKVTRVVVLFDGSNLYHRLKEQGVKETLDFKYADFTKFLVGNRRQVSATYYVGAVRVKKQNPKSKLLFSNQMKLFSRLRSAQIKISRGYILKTDGYHEKGVDVKIATDLLVGAFEDTYDTAILVSSDTDLLPAIDWIRKHGRKDVEYVGFGHKPSFALQTHCSESRLLIRIDLEKFIRK